MVVLKTSHVAAGLLAAIVVASFCLRAPFTCVGPLTDVIQTDLDLSSGTMGTVTTIPLLMFAAFSVAFGDLGRRHSAGWVMTFGLFMILTGVVCRSLLGTWGLFLGTAVMGMGITAGNVLLPAIIKARFPEKIGPLTGLYTAMLSFMSAVAGAISVPIGDTVGWKGSLAVWAVLIIIAIVVWIPQRGCSVDEDVPEPGSRMRLLRSPTTWLIAMYLGLQSLIYYALVAWLPVIIQSKGMDPSEAGMVSSVFMVLGIAGSLFLPVIIGRRTDIRAIGASIGVAYVVGLVLLIYASGSYISLTGPILLCGLCGGACITYPSMLFGLRTRNSGDSSSVSGIAQSVGYVVAAFGPVTVGSIYDTTADWGLGLAPLVCVALSLIVFGYLIGRDISI